MSRKKKGKSKGSSITRAEMPMPGIETEKRRETIGKQSKATSLGLLSRKEIPEVSIRKSILSKEMKKLGIASKRLSKPQKTKGRNKALTQNQIMDEIKLRDEFIGSLGEIEKVADSEIPERTYPTSLKFPDIKAYFKGNQATKKTEQFIALKEKESRFVEMIDDMTIATIDAGKIPDSKRAKLRSQLIKTLEKTREEMKSMLEKK